MPVLVLPRRLRAEIEADVLGRYPEEACGVLIGERGPDRSVAWSVRVEENVHPGDRRRRFAVRPARLLAIQQEARAAGRVVVGYYHSHPSSRALPSATDLAAAWPETSYLILSVESAGVGEIRSWRLAESAQGFEEEEIEYPSA